MAPDMNTKCQWCGNIHPTPYACPRIKSIEYDSYGQVAKIEFHAVNAAHAKKSDLRHIDVVGAMLENHPRRIT